MHKQSMPHRSFNNPSSVTIVACFFFKSSAQLANKTHFDMQLRVQSLFYLPLMNVSIGSTFILPFLPDLFDSSWSSRDMIAPITPLTDFSRVPVLAKDNQ